jgi:hypothetical protein
MGWASGPPNARSADAASLGSVAPYWDGPEARPD